MSRAIIKSADAENNSYTVEVPSITADRSPVQIPAQCVTKDVLEVGTEVNIVDINNQSPESALGFEGILRILPNKGEFVYSTDKIWKTFDEIYQTSPNSAAYGFLYSSALNRRWQKECPLYTFGNVIEIVDQTTLKVTAQMPYLKYYEWPTLTCRTDYMTCNTDAFEIGDIAVIKFENNDINQPVCVGFWINPQDCYWEDWNNDNPSHNHYWISDVGFQADPANPIEYPWMSNPFIASQGSYMKTEDGWFESVSKGSPGLENVGSNFLSSSLTIYGGPNDGTYPEDPMRYTAAEGIFEIHVDADAGPDAPIPNIQTSIQIVLYDANGIKYMIMVAAGSAQAQDFSIFYDHCIDLNPFGTSQVINGVYQVDLNAYGWANPGHGLYIYQYSQEEDSILRINYIDFR